MKQKDGSDFWDRRSREFDKQVLNVYKNAYKKTVKRSLAFLDRENRVLEIGCGTGIVTMQLADSPYHTGESFFGRPCDAGGNFRSGASGSDLCFHRGSGRLYQQQGKTSGALSLYYK